MRRSSLITGLLAAAVLASTAVPARAVPVNAFGWLACEGTTKLAQANAAIDGRRTVGWDAIPPSQSYQSGSGCGSAETFAAGSSQPDAVLDLPMAGTFTGSLGSMSVRLFAVDTSARAVEFQQLLVDVIIDGRTWVRQAPINVPIERSSSGAIGRVDFSVSNIGVVSDGTVAHSMEVRVSTRYPDVGTLNGWVWDATEFPSRIEFNPVKLAPVRIKAEA